MELAFLMPIARAVNRMHNFRFLEKRDVCKLAMQD